MLLFCAKVRKKEWTAKESGEDLTFLRFVLVFTGNVVSLQAKTYKQRKIMEAITTSESVTLLLPNADMSFLRTLSKKMGWTIRRHRKTGIEKGLDDIKKGNVYHAKNSEDLIKQILG